MTAPCKDCPDRTTEPNCHTNCPRYRAYRDARDEMLRKKAEEKSLMYGRPGEKDREQWREMYKRKVHGNK